MRVLVDYQHRRSLLESGEKIRDFILEKKIGEGGVGEVWRVYHQALKKHYAIKVIYPHLSNQPHFHERFIREAITMVNLEHPHIVGAHDFFSLDGKSFLIMSYIDGGSLADILKERGPLPVEETIRISQGILDALNFAHSRGVIHRDVKPNNILLRPDGHPYLVDFGIAIEMGQPRMTQFGTNVGTPEYMSPEQIKAGKIDHRTDVYSYGCVMYEMLSGRLPFGGRDEGKGDYEIMSGHLDKKPDSIRKYNPEVDEYLEAVVLRAMAKNSDDRFGGCSAMADALVVQATTEKSPPEEFTQRLKKLEKARKVLLAVALFLLLTTVAGAIGWISGKSNSALSVENQKLRKAIVTLDQALEQSQRQLLSSKKELDICRRNQ